MAERSIRTKWPYILFGFAAASLLLFVAPASERPHWTSYLEVSWGIWALAICSILFFASPPAGATVVTIAAILIVLIYGLNFLIVLSNAPHYGGVLWLTLVVLGAVIACAIVSIGIARQRAP